MHGMIDRKKLEETVKPVERVLNCDWGGLCRTEEVKRIALWNEIESNQVVFEEELLRSLSLGLGQHYLSQFALAKLLLASASFLRKEDNVMTSSFNEKEIKLACDFERYNVFDILSREEIVERIARRDELFTLIRGIYEGQYAALDAFLDSQEVRRDLKLAFKQRFERRLAKIKEAVKAYVDRYGPDIVVRQIERHVWEKIKASEQERARLSEQLRLRLQEILQHLKPLEKVEKDTQAFREKLLSLEENALEGLPTDLSSLRTEKDSLFGVLDEIEKELSLRAKEMASDRKALEEREAELRRMAEEYRRQAEEEKRRIIESELGELEKLRQQFFSREKELDEERGKLELKKKELEERLSQLEEIAGGGSVRWVTAEVARLAERNFIGRFDQKMHASPPRIFSPLENRSFTLNPRAEGAHLRLAQAADATKPQNESSRYIISERRYRLFGEKLIKVIIEALSFNHLEEFERYGFDLRRAGLADFLSLVGPRIREAEDGGYLHILGIASSTGWDERLLKEISSETFARNYLSPHISVCLVDAITGEAFYSPSDRRIAELIEHFRPEFEEEKTARLKKMVLEELILKGYASFREFAQRVAEPENLVLKVFYDIERKGQGRSKYIKEVGLCLIKG